MRVLRNVDARQDGWRTYPRLSDDGRGASVESEIWEVHLWQDEDQREQEKLKAKQSPTPRLHQIHLLLEGTYRINVPVVYFFLRGGWAARLQSSFPVQHE